MLGNFLSGFGSKDTMCLKVLSVLGAVGALPALLFMQASPVLWETRGFFLNVASCVGQYDGKLHNEVQRSGGKKELDVESGGKKDCSGREKLTRLQVLSPHMGSA